MTARFSNRAYFGDSDTVDYMSRYDPMSSMMQPVGFPGLGSANDTSSSARDRVEKHFIGELAGGDDNTVISKCNRYDSYVSEIKNLVQVSMGNFDRAQEKYNVLKNISSDNQDGFARMEAYYGTGGQTTDRLAANAAKIRSGEFNSTAVTLADGTETTFGKLFGDGGYRSNLYGKLSNFGFSSSVADAYYGDDSDKSRAVGVFVQPVVSRKTSDMTSEQGTPGEGVHPSYVQLNDAAGYVADNYDGLVKVFGKDGTMKLAQSVLVSNGGTTGGMTDMMAAVYAYATKFPGDAPWGSTKVRSFMSSIDSVRQYVFHSADPTKSFSDLTDDQKRYVTLAVVNAMKEADTEVDFDSAPMKAAMRQAASVFARSLSGNRDLFVESRVTGRSIASDLGQYILMSSEGDTIPADNAIKAQDDMRASLNARIEGAPTVSEVMATSGNVQDYATKSAMANGQRSTSTVADDMKKDVIDAIERNVGPHVMTGTRFDDAFVAVMSDPDMKKKLENDVTYALLSRSGLSGSAGGLLAKSMAASLLDTLASSGDRDGSVQDLSKFSIARFMSELAINPADMGDPDYAARVAAQGWYLANVSRADQFSDYRRRITNHMMVMGEMDRESASSVSAHVIQRVSELLAHGKAKEANEELRRATSVGVIYNPKFVKDRDNDVLLPVFIDENGEETTKETAIQAMQRPEHVPDLDAANTIYVVKTGNVKDKKGNDVTRKIVVPLPAGSWSSASGDTTYNSSYIIGTNRKNAASYNAMVHFLVSKMQGHKEQ